MGTGLKAISDYMIRCRAINKSYPKRQCKREGKHLRDNDWYCEQHIPGRIKKWTRLS